MDPAANGQVQRHWSWLIAAYLFLGGVGAGAYAIAAINGFLGKEMELSTRVGLWIGFPALLIGSIFLILDLGAPARAVLAGVKVRTSWIARGTWIISTFMVMSFLHLVLFQWGGYRMSGEGSGLLGLIAIVGIITAIGTMAYTGLLLGASKGIPFWRSGMVPLLFVVSALVTGHCATMLLMAPFAGGPDAVHALRAMGIEAAVLVAIELLVIVLFLYSSHKLAETRESTARILANRAFVYGYFVFGLGAPLVLMVYLGAGRGATALGSLVAVAVLGAALGLLGGLILRWAVLTAGTMPIWRVAGMEFHRIPKPKDPKPSMGLLPPS